ncbi:MAG: (2Fe-2S) ferredoxin [Rhodospirillales bacterium]|nr:(2Fe-2S) ferredoxin [Rhodospirillales bacterium]
MRVRFIDYRGVEHVVGGEPGESAMRCATAHLVPGIIGECGGAMACATCHGYVGDSWFDRIPAPSPQEREMLSGCIDRRPNSRLCCQIRLTEELDGLTITVPDSQT